MGRRKGDEKFYLDLAAKISKALEIDNPKMTISEVEDSIYTTNNAVELEKTPYGVEDVTEIVRIAKLLEGLLSGYGTHAAGIIISDNDDVSDYIPLINVSGAIDCQVDMNSVEAVGLLKLDLLGLRNLGIITECEKAVQKEMGISLSVNEFPIVPEVFSEIFAKGMTDGVFQFESDGMKNTLTNFGPTSMTDVTLLNAVFRPGPLQYIDDITAVKKGEAEPKYIIPEMEEILGSTYGKPVYQEQIMSIFNKIAGFSLGESDIIRRLMSKKKTDKFMAYKDRFIDGLVSKGAKKRDAEDFWSELVNFSQYAFNKSHARAYCEVAYATAYLKYMYPDAYACGLLSYTSTEKMPKIVLDTINQGTSVKCPDINYSNEDFSLCGSDVLFGLSSVPQVASSAALIVQERSANGKFTSFKDFLARVLPKKNVLTNLIYAGAFDSFGDRESLAAAAPNLLDVAKSIRDKQAIIDEEEFDSARAKRAQATLEKLQSEFENAELEDVSYNRMDLLNKEKELLGQYVSAHPMDGIKVNNLIKTLPINRFCNITALLTDLNVFTTKAGRQMAKFTLSDKTDSLNGVIFQDAFDKYGDLLNDSTILNFNGMAKNDGDRKQFVVSKIFPFKAYAKPIHLKAPVGTDIEATIAKRIVVFKDLEAGVPLDIYKADSKEVIRVMFPVDKQILKKEIAWIMQKAD